MDELAKKTDAAWGVLAAHTQHRPRVGVILG